MKRLTALLLAFAICFSLAACASSDNEPQTQKQQTDNPTATAAGGDVTQPPVVDESKRVTDLVTTFTTELSTWNVYYSWMPKLPVNFIDPLVSVDSHNNSIPALAESWSYNDDETVWTFNIRDGVTWVDYQGNYKADVVAEDWIWGLEWVLNFWKNDSYNTTVPMTFIKGAQEYYEYTQSLSEEEGLALGIEKFVETVGIETPDEHTVVYTCINPCPYFDSLATAVFFYPLAKGQLDEVGTKGYKSVSPFELWYCGPYVVSEFIEDNSKTIVPNPTYWDDSALLFDSITFLKTESQDTAWELFQLGEVNVAGNLSAATITQIANDPTNPWHDYLAKNPDTGVTWGIFFNYAKNNLDNTADTAWNTAVANENFRQCFYYGLDLYNYLATVDPVDPTSVARGSITVYGLASLSDGRDYTDLVYDLIDFDPYTNYSHQDLDKLAAYKAKAIEELTAEGVTFPVHVDLWAASSQSSTDTYTILKEILEDNLGTDFVDVEIHTYVTSKVQEVYYPGYMSIEIQGYGALYSDPMTYLTMLCNDMNGNAEFSDLYGHISDCTSQEVRDLFEEFTQKVRAANAITGDHDARYEALAEAEAFAIQHCLVFPTHTNAFRVITNINIYSKASAINDTQKFRYVNWETNSDYYTAEDIAAIRNVYLGNEG